MTLPAGSNCFTRIQDRLKATLAAMTATTTFLAYNGRTVVDPSAHIYVNALPVPAGDKYTNEESEALLPYIMIGTDDEERYSWVQDSAFGYSEQGVLLGRFVVHREVEDRKEPEKSLREMENMVGDILEEIAHEVMAGTPGTFPARLMTMGPAFKHEKGMYGGAREMMMVDARWEHGPLLGT